MTRSVKQIRRDAWWQRLAPGFSAVTVAFGGVLLAPIPRYDLDLLWQQHLATFDAKHQL